MVSRSLRAEVVPEDTTILTLQNLVPDGFSKNSNFYGKYLKQVETGATNPGTTGGAADHIHASDSHNHPTSGSTLHTHSTKSGTYIACFRGAFGVGSFISTASHKHTKGSTSTTPSLTVDSKGHTHNTVNNDPTHKEYLYLKKDSIIRLRQKVVPFKGILMWNLALANIPQGFVNETADVDRFINSVPDAATAPGTTSGSDTHQHDTSGTAHTHGVTIASHTHTYSGSWPASPDIVQLSAGSGALLADDDHTHTQTWNPTAANNETKTSDDPGTHTHDSTSNEPPFHRLSHIEHTVIGLRTSGIPKDTLLLWEGTLASIPTNFSLADGTGGTVNLLDKFIRQLTTSCEAPGGTGGIATHTHSSIGHTHIVSINHTHTISLPDSGSAPGTFNLASGNNSARAHSHGPDSVTQAGGPTSISLTSDAHTHGSIDHRPLWLEAAFIQKL